MHERLIADLSRQIRYRSPPREILVKRVANALRDQIASGRLKPGARLASEVALAQALEISRPTLREAIRILAREGLLRIRRGIGTFVAEEPRLIWARLDAMRSMTDLIRSVGGTPGDRGLRVEMRPAPPEVASALERVAGSPVGVVSRVRLIDERPLALADEYVALAAQDADFGRLSSFRGGSLYEFLHRHCAITLSHSSLEIAAVPADASRAAVLDLRPRTPLLRLRETHYDLDGKPVLFTVNYHNSEIVEFTLARAGLQT
ncbi:MAG: GntR family transcriptional regulator [Methylobacteriaceae bacterium]|nr:GntR family transcriptional regulator [Methylobacteriaceae bacterium]